MQTTEQLKQILINLGDYNFGVNSWGSCQYSGALAYYMAFKNIRELGIPREEACEWLGYNLTIPTPLITYGVALDSFIATETEDMRDRAIGDAIAELGNKYATELYPHPRPWFCYRDDDKIELGHYNLTENEFTGDFKLDYAHTVLKTITLQEFLDLHGLNLDTILSEDEYYSECILEMDTLKHSTKPEDLFEYTKSAAWDLWSAAPYIASLFDITLSSREDQPPAEFEQGLPLFNQMAQGENPKTGLCCALLVDLGIITNDNAFADFDT